MIPLEKQAMDSLLIFTLGEYKLAVDISEVESIIEVPIITSIPMLPDFVSGTFPFHGKVVTAIELRKKLGVATDCIEKSVVVISLIDKSLFGFKVDSVDTLANYNDFDLPGAKTMASGIKVCFSDNYGIVLLTSFEKLLDMGKDELQTLDGAQLTTPSMDSPHADKEEIPLTHSSETSLSTPQIAQEPAQESRQEAEQESIQETAQEPIQEPITIETKDQQFSEQKKNTGVDDEELESSRVEQQVIEEPTLLNTGEFKQKGVVLGISNEEGVATDPTTLLNSQSADSDTADELFEYALGLLDAEDNIKSESWSQKPSSTVEEFDHEIAEYNKLEDLAINETRREIVVDSSDSLDEIKIGEEFDEAIPLKIDKPFPVKDSHFSQESETDRDFNLANGIKSLTDNNVRSKSTLDNEKFGGLGENYLQAIPSVLESDNFYSGKKPRAEKRPKFLIHSVSIIIVLGITTGLYWYYSSGESATTLITHSDVKETASLVASSPSQATPKDNVFQPQEKSTQFLGDTRHQAASQNLPSSESNLVPHIRDRPPVDSVRVLQIESPKYTISVDRPVGNTTNVQLEKKIIQIKPKKTPVQIAAPSQLFKNKTHSSGDMLITHTVVKGDTLWRLAGKYLNNPYRYPELAELSDIRNPDLIYPGDRVTFGQKL